MKVTYLRSDLANQPANIKETVDPGFQNDQYWLLLPFHAVWDGAVVEDSGQQKLPSGNGSAEKVVIKYSDSGYSPGDTWELYVRSDSRIEEMVFRRRRGKARGRHRRLDRPQEGRPLARLARSSGHGRRQAAPYLFLERIGQARRVG